MLEKKNHGFMQMMAKLQAPGTREWLRFVGCCLVLLVLLGAFLVPLSDARPIWVWYLLDALHLPAFFMVTLLCFRLVGPFVQDARRTVWIGLMCAVVLAGGIEVIQGFIARTPDLRDAVSGWMGAGLAALCQMHRVRNPVFVPAVIAAIIFAVFPLVAEAGALHWRESRFPVLGDFSTWRSARLWEPQGGASIRSARDTVSTAVVLEVRTATGEWSGVSFRAGGGSWKRHRTLEITVINPGTSLYLGTRVDDADGRIFQDGFLLQPGRNVLRIPVSEILEKAESVDPQIRRLALFVAPDQEAATFWVRSARLVE